MIEGPVPSGGSRMHVRRTEPSTNDSRSPSFPPSGLLAPKTLPENNSLAYILHLPNSS